MFRNYLAAATRNLARNKLYSTINISGLAIGFAAAIFIALFVRDELTYEHSIPGYREVYRVSTIFGTPGAQPVYAEGTNPEVAEWLKLEFPQLRAVARLMNEWVTVYSGEMVYNDPVDWVDPQFLTVFPLPFIAGNARTALSEPDSLVLTRATARKYFGRDAPLGATLVIEGHDHARHPMRVTAVLEDLPSNTHLKFVTLGNARAAFSPYLDSTAKQGVSINPLWHTYIRLSSGESAADLQQRMTAMVARHMHLPAGFSFELQIIPISAIHLHPAGLVPMKLPGDPRALRALAAIGVLIVLIASINFVNLMTARAADRAVEVGVRKACGAGRGDLARQFVGEALMHIIIGMVLALSLVELAMPHFNALIDRSMGDSIAPGIKFDYWSDPLLGFGVLGAALAVGVLAGAYPAFVLSAFRPSQVLKGGVRRIAGSATLRQTLVIVQFAILVGLMVVTAVIYRQTLYAMHAGLRLDTDQVLLVYFRTSPRNNDFRDAIASLPGVRAVTGAKSLPTNYGEGQITVERQGRAASTLRVYAVDADFLQFYGLRPLAGRFFSRERESDVAHFNFAAPIRAALVLNEAAVRSLGFESAAAAVDEPLSLTGRPQDRLQIIGVTPDFPADTLRLPIAPSAYYFDPTDLAMLDVRLSGHEIPETLAAIERVWKQYGEPSHPFSSQFLDHHYEYLYSAIRQEEKLIVVFASIALLVACLGLFGLSVFTAQQRIREISIRKAMGAGSSDILRLLLWQFTQPILWANLIAWPCAAYLMNRWLHGFAYHVDLEPWTFVLAAAAAMVIAVMTVGVHSFRVSRVSPIAALHHE